MKARGNKSSLRRRLYAFPVFRQNPGTKAFQAGGFACEKHFIAISHPCMRATMIDKRSITSVYHDWEPHGLWCSLKPLLGNWLCNHLFPLNSLY